MRIIIKYLFPLFITCSISAQTKLQGVVKNHDGQGLGHASIELIDTKQTVITDSMGFFTLDGFDTGELTISSIGYHSKNRKILSAQEWIEITLEKANHLIEEVEINTGYQTVPKERATGSFVHIDSALLQTRISDNIMDKIEYSVAGLQFDNRTGSAKINIRGVNTFSSALTEPLIIVDNFPYSGNIGNINPNDVESVSILKDAAATSIWGARAGNGVIVITLKKNSGQNRQISVTSNTSLSTKPDLSYIPAMRSADFIEVERMLYDQGFYAGTLNSTLAKRYVFSPVVDLLRKVEMGDLSEEEMEREISSFKNIDYRDDIMRGIYRNPVKQQLHVGLDMQTGMAGYRLGVGFDKNKNDLVGSERKRLSLVFNSHFALTNGLDIHNTISFTPTVNQAYMSYPTYPINPGGGKVQLYPYASLMDGNGDPMAIPYRYKYDYIESLADKGLLDWFYRPMEDFNHNSTTNRNDHLTISPSISYKFLDFIDVKLQYGFEQQKVDIESIYGEKSFHSRDFVNRFTQEVNGELTYNVPLGAIIHPAKNRMHSHRARVQINMDKQVTPFLKAVVFAGSEINSTSTESNSSVVYGFDENILTSGVVDFVNPYPIYDNLAGNSRIPGSFGFSETHRRYVSLFGNGVLDLKGRYLFSISARRDASNLFGVTTNNKWNPLWSAGVSWILSNEPFFDGKDWINFLKIRSTLGHSGNLGGVATTLPIIYYSDRSGYGLSQLRRAMVSTLPNPNLRWENVKTINYGVDFRLFSSKISGSVEYYTKYASDLLASDELDPTTGFSTTRRNVGEMSGKGIDLQLDGRYNIGKVNFTSTLLWSMNKNKVIKHTGVVSRASFYATSNSTSLLPLDDKMLYPVFSYRYAGLDGNTGDPIGYIEGEESMDYAQILNDSLQSLNYHGSALPIRHGAFRQSINWRSLRVSANIVFKAGHYFRNSTIMYNTLFRSWVGHSDFEKRWQRPGDEKNTSVPSMTYPGNANRDSFYAYSEANVERADIIRLNDIQISYSTGPLAALANTQLDVYLNINNVGVLWRENKAGRDPDYLDLPAPRTFTIGCKLNL